MTKVSVISVVALTTVIACNYRNRPYSPWQTAAEGFCRTAFTTAETYRTKAGVYPANDTATAGSEGDAGTLFENTVGPPACSIISPLAARTYTFTYTRDADMSTAKWTLTAITAQAGSGMKNFFIDETGVLRAETEPTVPTNASPPYKH